MAARKNEKATTKPKGKKKPGKKVMAKASTAPESSKKIKAKKATTKATTVAKTRTAAGTKAAAKKEVATPGKEKESFSLIDFKLKAPDAHAVFLAGDFNGWLVDKDKMDKGKDGIWRKSMRLQHGRYEYQFVVDGNWWTDPENPNRTWNPFGTQNSVKEV